MEDRAREKEGRRTVGRQSVSRPKFSVTSRIKATLTKKKGRNGRVKKETAASLFTQVRVGRRREKIPLFAPRGFPARFLALKGGRSQLLRSNNTNNKDEFALFYFFFLFLISTPPLRSSRLSLRSKGRASGRGRNARRGEKERARRRGWSGGSECFN